MPFFRQFGVMRMVEGWGDDVPRGKVTDFQGAVQAKDDETVVFSWMEYPDKATYEAANRKMKDDPRMKEMFANMPFDGKRVIFGGFESIVDEAGEGAAGYADGYVVPVPNGNKKAYREMAAKAADVFKEYGATRVVEAWGDDVPDGKVTDFKRAVKAKQGENVVFSFVEWPDKATRDAAWPKIMEDRAHAAGPRQDALRRAAHVLGRIQAPPRRIVQCKRSGPPGRLAPNRVRCISIAM